MMTKAFLRNMYATAVALVTMMFALPAVAQSPQAYVVKGADGHTLTFYYDTLKPARPDGVYGINDTKTDEAGDAYPAWAGSFDNINTAITHVKFDPSFKDYRPTSTALWFNFCIELTQITGMEHLNTSEVTTMHAMFSHCLKLSTLDVSHFNTAKVNSMWAMFNSCKSLTSLDVSAFNMANATDLQKMFLGCEQLAVLDATNFNPVKAANMENMFVGCFALTTIYCNYKWACPNSRYMFDGCEKLNGAAKYDANRTDVAMANPTTGYFTKKVSTGIASLPHPTTSTQLPTPNAQHPVYNLQGARMSQSWEALPKGMYIVNGKKIMKP